MCFGYSNIVSLQAFGFGLGNVKFSRVSSWRCRLWGLFFAIYSLSAYALMHKVEIDCYCNMIVQLSAHILLSNLFLNNVNYVTIHDSAVVLRIYYNFSLILENSPF